MCMCGCAYLNGWGAIIGVQMFALIGLLFSIATLGDCSFVELDERLFLPSDLDEEDLPLKVTQTGYVGLLTWQMLDGNCYFYTEGADWEGQINTYIDILGTDFELARLLAYISTCLNFVFVCYLLSFTCSSQVRGVRLTNVIFLTLILPGLQGVVFILFASDFCDDYGCTFSRSAGFCVGAMASFFLSGLCFLCASEYPGPQPKSKKPRMMSIMQVAPEAQAFETKEEPVRNSYMYNSEEFVMQEYEDEEVVEEEGEEEVVEEVEEELEEEVVEEEYTEEYSEHADLAAGEDMTYYTEVTESETRTLQTITHADGSQTVTETVTEAEN